MFATLTVILKAAPFESNMLLQRKERVHSSALDAFKVFAFCGPLVDFACGSFPHGGEAYRLCRSATLPAAPGAASRARARTGAPPELWPGVAHAGAPILGGRACHQF